MTSHKPLADLPAPQGDVPLFVIDPIVLESIPAAAYTCAADGTIGQFNARASELWGRAPRLGDTNERFCGSYRLYDLKGNHLPHEQTPMATALKTGEAQRGKEVVIERPDGSRIIVLVHINAIKDREGRVAGAFNCFQDITAQKRDEEELQKSRADLEDFFDNSVVPMHWVGKDGTILRANQAELRLLGYDWSEYVGRHIAEFHVDREKINDILSKLSSGEVLNKFPARLRAKDSSVKEVLISSSSRFRGGELINTRCVTVDVTAETKAQEIVRESERRTRELLEALPAPIYTTDIKGRITYYNQAAADLWGVMPKLGESLWCGSWRLYWPDGSPMPHDECPMAIALKEQRPVRNMEAVLERPDGSRVSFIPFPTPLRNASGEVVGAVNMLVDITERKKGEEAGRRLAAIVESSEDAIISKDLNGVVQSWNPAAEHLFGYSAEEMIGKSIRVIIPSDRRFEEDNILSSIRRGERIEHYETIRRRKGGRLMDISLTVSPVVDADGKVIGASKIARDITERKRAEAALARSLKEHRILYELTDKLHRAQSFEEVYEASFEAIMNALDCQRASILLYDKADVMRFVAWRGLSEGYREATEGHSPWTPDARDPDPICVDDVSKASFPEGLQATIEREGVGALAFIPLVAGGRLLGKFMIYYDAPHAFAENEIKLALSIARQLGFAAARIRAGDARRAAEADLRRSEARERERARELHTIMETAPAVIWVARDTEGRHIDGNSASYEFLRLAQQRNASLSAPPGERPENFRVLVEGRELAPNELPVQRAARGEDVRGILFETRFDDGTSRFLFGNATPLRDAAGAPTGAVSAFVDITERIEAEKQRDLMIAELNHRVKNTLATVISIAGQSFSADRDVNAALASFKGRIRALAHTHTRLAEENWSGVSLEALLLDEFAPYRREDGANVRVGGPAVTLTPKSAVMLGMAMHELATNAAKYGALSVNEGAVDVSWKIAPGEDDALEILWAERGGPRVRAPKRAGFGRLLIERALAVDLGGDVALDFAAEGLKCSIVVPLERNVARAL